jgi:hypothetical protein
MPSLRTAKVSRLSLIGERSATTSAPGLRITNYRHRAVIAFRIDESTDTVAILGVYYGGRNYESELGADRAE